MTTMRDLGRKAFLQAIRDLPAKLHGRPHYTFEVREVSDKDALVVYGWPTHDGWATIRVEVDLLQAAMNPHRAYREMMFAITTALAAAETTAKPTTPAANDPFCGAYDHVRG